MRLRILIADDHGVLRAGLRALLSGEADFSVVGEAKDSETVIQLACELCPDIILMDLSMPKIGGIEATRQLCRYLPGVRILILTVHEDPELLLEALQAGASGYILKLATEMELITAIRAVAHGEVYVHSAMMRAFLEEPHHSPMGSPHELLTPRELDVLLLIVQGCSNKQIAAELHIGVHTVESQRANLMDKLDLHSRVELERYSIDNEIIKPDYFFKQD